MAGFKRLRRRYRVLPVLIALLVALTFGLSSSQADDPPVGDATSATDVVSGLQQVADSLTGLNDFDELANAIPLTERVPTAANGLDYANAFVDGLKTQLASAPTTSLTALHDWLNDPARDTTLPSGVQVDLSSPSVGPDGNGYSLGLQLELTRPGASAPFKLPTTDSAVDVDGGSLALDLHSVLSLTVKYDPTQLGLNKVYLDAASNPALDTTAGVTWDGASFNVNLGVAQVAVGGSASASAGVRAQLLDPDGNGRITQDELAATSTSSLFTVSYTAQTAAANLSLAPSLTTPLGGVLPSASVTVDDHDFSDGIQASVDLNGLGGFKNITPQQLLSTIASLAIMISSLENTGPAAQTLPFLGRAEDAANDSLTNDRFGEIAKINQKLIEFFEDNNLTTADATDDPLALNLDPDGNLLNVDTIQEIGQALMTLLGLSADQFALAYDPATSKLSFDLKDSATLDPVNAHVDFSDQLKNIGIQDVQSDVDATITPSYDYDLPIAIDLSSPVPVDPSSGTLSDRISIDTNEAHISADAPITAQLDLVGRVGFLGVSLISGAGPTASTVQLLSRRDTSKPMLNMEFDGGADHTLTLTDIFHALGTTEGSLADPMQILDASDIGDVLNATVPNFDILASAQFGEPSAPVATVSGTAHVGWADVTDPSTLNLSLDPDFSSNLLDFAFDPENPEAMFGLILNTIGPLVDQLAQQSTSNDFLKTKLPVVNASFGDLVNQFQKIRDTLNGMAANPSVALQAFEQEIQTAIGEALNVPEANRESLFDVELDTSGARPVVKFHLAFGICGQPDTAPADDECNISAPFELPLNLELPSIGGLVGAEAGGSIRVDYKAVAHLDFGIRLPSVTTTGSGLPAVTGGESPELFLLNTTSVKLDVNASGQGHINASVGPLQLKIGQDTATGEEAAECDNDVDDDGDGSVNDGCPAVGNPETGLACADNLDENTQPAGGTEADGAADKVNDGCPAIKKELVAKVAAKFHLENTGAPDEIALADVPSFVTGMIPTSLDDFRPDSAHRVDCGDGPKDACVSLPLFTTDNKEIGTADTPSYNTHTPDGISLSADNLFDTSTWDGPNVDQDIVDYLIAQALDWTTLVHGVTLLSDNLATSLRSASYGTRDIPVLGDVLDGGADVAEAFHDNIAVPIDTFVTQLETDGVTDFGELQSRFQTFVFDHLDSTHFLLKQDGTEGATASDVTVLLRCGTDYASLHTCASPGDGITDVFDAQVRFTMGEADGNHSVPFDLGFPGLRLKTDQGSALTTHVGWHLNIGFGLSKTHGFYVLTDVDSGSDPWHNEAELAANISVDAPASMQGDIAFLRVDITDNTPGSDAADHEVTLETGLDISGGEHDADGETKLGLDALASTDPATSPNLTLSLGGAVHLDLHLVTTIDLPGSAEDDMPGGGDPTNGAMPKLLADFHLDWDFGAHASLQGAGLDIGDLDVGFEDVQLDVGQFFGQFLGPIVREVKRFTQPLQPVIDTIQAPIPGISDLSELAGQGQVTFLDFFEKVSGADLTMIRRLITLINMINHLPESGTTLTLGDGSFDLSPTALDGQAPSPDQADNLIVAGTAEAIDSIFDSPGVITNPAGRDAFEAATDAQAGHEGGGVSFPAFEHPEQLFQMLVGKDVRLIRVDLGTLRASFAFDITIGPFPAGPIPVSIVIGGSAGVEGRFAVVYTTRGIRTVVQKLTDDNPDNDDAALVADLIFQGVGLDDLDGAGTDVPEIRLWAEVHAGAAVDVKIISVGIVVGLIATVDLNLHDGGRLPPDGHPDPAQVDGVLYIDEIIKAMSNPLCLFDVSGALDAYVKFFVEIGFSPFSVEFEITLVQIRLLDMQGLEKELCDPKPPHLAQQSGTTLVLKIGPHTPGRNVDEDKPKEKIVVRQIPPRDGDPSGPGHRFSVTGFGITQEYPEEGHPLVEKIFADGGSDNDQILMQTGVQASKGAAPSGNTPGQVNTTFLPVDVPVELCGGDGNDKIVGGTHGDHLVGDGHEGGGFTCTTGEAGTDGNDELDGQGGNDTLDGTGGGDTLIGGDGGDTINAGSGSDQAKGGQGEDHIFGQAGDDPMLEGGPEANTPGQIADEIDGGDGVDILQGDEGADTMRGGNQDDTLGGGPGGDDMEGNADNDTLVGNDGDDVMKGGPGHDRVFGQQGADDMWGDNVGNVFAGGNDDLVGDIGTDEIHGGGGRDYVLGDRGGIERNPGDANAVVTPDQTVGNDDTIDGDGGNDVVYGEKGVDTVHGGPNDDEIHGDADGDFLFGDANDDTMFGGIGADDMSGGPNEDVMRGDDGTDTMHGDGEHDVMFGDAGVDTMFGDGGPDRMRGGTEADVMHGNDGEDVMNGDAHGDQMFGDADHDVMSGDADEDYMEGNGADDTMSGGAGQDDILGGTGGALSAGQPDAGDTICGYDCFTPLLAPDVVSDADVIVGDNGEITRPGGVRADGAWIRTVHLVDLDAAPGVYGDDTVSGDYGPDRIFGGRGNDTLHGNAADDEIEGNGDNDSIFGDEGQDDLIGGTSQDGGGHTDGADCIQGDARTNDCHGDGSGSGSAAGGTGGGSGNADVIVGDNGSITRTANAAGIDWVRDTFGPGYVDIVKRTKTLFDVATLTTPAPAGTSGGDTIYGDVSYDLMFGQGDDDEIHGGDGDDYAEGNAGTDTMFGENDSDDLLGGSADATWLDVNDVMSGGAGFDVMAGDNAKIGRPRDGAAGPWFLDTRRVGEAENVVRRAVELLNVDVSGAAAPEATLSGGDTMSGGDAYDVLFGQGAVDTVHGDAGDDYVEGNAAGDTLFGDAGDDDVTGGGSANDGVIDDDRSGENLRDGADTINGDSGDPAVGAGDAIAADNARILRPLAGTLWQTDADRGATMRDIQLFDLQKVGDAAFTAPADASDSDTVHGDGGPDVIFGQGNGANGDAYGTESGAAGTADCFDGHDNGDANDPFNPLADVSDPTCRAATPNGDKLYGDDGVDYLEGNQGSDLVSGGNGEDDVVGGSSANTGQIAAVRKPAAARSTAETTPEKLLDGNDVVQGDGEDDTVVGDNAFVDRYVGPGFAWQHITSTLAGPVTSIDGGQYGPYDLVRRNVTMLQTPDSAGAFGSDLALGNDGADDLYGQLGDDWLEGGAGDDGIVADLGRIDDNLLGTAADGLVDPALNQQIAPQQPFIKDTINVTGVLKRQVTLYAFTGTGAGKGNDTAQGGGDNDWIHMGPGEDLANGNAGEDRLYGGDNTDTRPLANNQAKVDALWGGEGHDHEWGGYGADFIDVRPRTPATAPGLPQADPPTWFQIAGKGIADFQGVDYIYGGWDQDAMQANEGDNGPNIGDRLLDWAGSFNVYYVCPGTYGDWISTRLLAPGMIDFLQNLSGGDGADAPTTSSPAPGSSGFRETAIVFNADIKNNTNPVHPDTPGHFTCVDTEAP
ncbi:MAG TPA: hypothetical protein VGJ77_10570 [Gaiellaceae bacterium]